MSTLWAENREFKTNPLPNLEFVAVSATSGCTSLKKKFVQRLRTPQLHRDYGLHQENVKKSHHHLRYGSKH